MKISGMLVYITVLSGNVWTCLLLLQILIVNVTFVLSEKWANAQNLLTLLIDDFSLQLSAFLMMTLLRRSAPI